jgi:hypothetical protein
MNSRDGISKCVDLDSISYSGACLVMTAQTTALPNSDAKENVNSLLADTQRIFAMLPQT